MRVPCVLRFNIKSTLSRSTVGRVASHAAVAATAWTYARENSAIRQVSLGSTGPDRAFMILNSTHYNDNRFHSSGVGGRWSAGIVIGEGRSCQHNRDRGPFQ